MTLSENTSFPEVIMNLKHSVQVSGKRIKRWPAIDNLTKIPGKITGTKTLPV